MLKRDGYQCQLHLPGCTLDADEVDHIRPGDDHRSTNLQAACHACHARKSGQEGAAAANHRWAARKRPPTPHPGIIGP